MGNCVQPKCLKGTNRNKKYQQNPETVEKTTKKEEESIKKCKDNPIPQQVQEERDRVEIGQRIHNNSEDIHINISQSHRRSHRRSHRSSIQSRIPRDERQSQLQQEVNHQISGSSIQSISYQYQVLLLQAILNSRDDETRFQNLILLLRLVQVLEMNNQLEGFTPEEIAKIKKVKFQDRQGDCAICQDIVRPRQIVSILSCNHYYHSQCINPWLQKSTLCPMCRVKVELPN